MAKPSACHQVFHKMDAFINATNSFRNFGTAVQSKSVQFVMDSNIADCSVHTWSCIPGDWFLY